MSPDKRTFSYSGSRKNINATKNRHASAVSRRLLILMCVSMVLRHLLILADDSRIFLSPVPGQPSDSSYINAATVDVRCN